MATDNQPTPTPAASEPGHDAVLVGVDGTEKDLPVVTWAAHEAALRSVPLRVVTVVDAALTAMPSGDIVAAGPAVLEALEADAMLALDKAEDTARAAEDSVVIERGVLHGSPTAALLEAAQSAALLVTGGGRKTTLQKILLGTTSLNVAMHAPCPAVLIAHDTPPTPTRNEVVVGVDGSEHSSVALDLAFAEAALRGAPVHVATSWGVEVVDGVVVTTPGSSGWEAVEGKYRAKVEAFIATHREQNPDVPVTITVRPGQPANLLTELGDGAALLVIGSRGRGGFRGALLGSVGHRVLQTATCPVAVVRKH